MEAYTKKQLRELLYNVIDELNLSESMLQKCGPLGTEPSELVRLVLEQKDRQIAMLKSGMKEIKPN